TQLRHRARARRAHPAARRGRLPGTRLPREDGAPARCRPATRRRLHLGRAGRDAPRRVAHRRLLGAGAPRPLHHPRLLALPAGALEAGGRLRSAVRRNLRGLGLLARRRRTWLGGALRSRSARLLPAQPERARDHLARAGRQEPPHAHDGRQAPRALRGAPRGGLRGDVRTGRSGGSGPRAHLSPSTDPLRDVAPWPAQASARAMTATRLSIIIRCRDEAAHLGGVLDAVLAQTDVPAFEVLALDSGSQDGTLELLARHPVRVEHLPSEAFTFGRALNRGAAVARGDLLVYLSAHCRPLTPRWLAALVAPFADASVVATFGRQVPLPGVNPIEAIAMRRNFPPAPPALVRFSNANGALRRAAVLARPFDEEIPAAEDHVWACGAGPGERVE